MTNQTQKEIELNQKLKKRKETLVKSFLGLFAASFSLYIFLGILSIAQKDIETKNLAIEAQKTAAILSREEAADRLKQKKAEVEEVKLNIQLEKERKSTMRMEAQNSIASNTSEGRDDSRYEYVDGFKLFRFSESNAYVNYIDPDSYKSIGGGGIQWISISIPVDSRKARYRSIRRGNCSESSINFIFESAIKRSGESDYSHISDYKDLSNNSAAKMELLTVCGDSQ
jgi:hypothetical protein